MVSNDKLVSQGESVSINEFIPNSESVIESATASKAFTVAAPEITFQNDEQQFLQIYLDISLPVLLSVNQLVEILTMPMGQIVPMFEMPGWVAGVYNWRGEVLWMVDLNHFLGLTPWYQQRQYGSKHTAIVVNASPHADLSMDGKDHRLGLMVNRVGDMVLCSPNSTAPPSISSQFVSPDISPEGIAKIDFYSKGYWCSSDNIQHLILDSSAIINAISAY